MVLCGKAKLSLICCKSSTSGARGVLILIVAKKAGDCCQPGIPQHEQGTALIKQADKGSSSQTEDCTNTAAQGLISSSPPLPPEHSKS